MEENAKKCLTMEATCGILSKLSVSYGSIAQLGEHLPYTQRVIGSSPIVPTIFLTDGKGLPL